MTTRKPPSPSANYFERLLDERFDRLHERLNDMDKRFERRDFEVNMLDTTNKAEIKSVKDRVIVVETEIGKVRYLLKAALWVITAVGGVVSWAFDLWGSIASALKHTV